MANGTYVNTNSGGSLISSTNYFIDPDLLTNISTTAWWVSGGNNNAQLEATLTSSNRQQIPIALNGQFETIRPQVYDYLYFVPVASIITNQGFPYLIGDGGLDAYITNSVFSGQAGVTQLVYGYETNTLVGVTTTNSWELDNVRFVITTPNNLIGLLPVYPNFPESTNYNRVLDYDQPSDEFGGGATNAAQHFDFKDYVMFQPSTANAIFVPLGMINWHIYSTAGISNSIPILTSTPDVYTDTNFIGSTDFPKWTNVFINNGTGP